MGNVLTYLIHWNEAERAERADELSQLGFDVLTDLLPGSKMLKNLEKLDPQALVIDLTRIPSQGRDLGVALRVRKGTRLLPLVFVGGEQSKVEKIQELLPDAYYCEWDDIETCIQMAIETPLEQVVIPESVFAAYAEKRLVEKLGIKTDQNILVINAPDNLTKILGDLPERATLLFEVEQELDLVIWFERTQSGLQAELDTIVGMSKRAPIWISWPKKGSGLSSDLTQSVVREICMGAGMVDYKVCSLDRTWTALLFTWRGS